MSKKEVLDLLSELDFPHQKRPNIRRQGDDKPSGFVLGWVNNRPSIAKMHNLPLQDISKASKREKYKPLYEAAKKLMKSHNPNFKFSSIQVNKNNRTAKHIDGYNVGESYMIGLGNYNGGDLIIYDEDGNNPKSYPTKNKWIKFNGSIYPHETKAFTGDRYTLVFYNILGKKKSDK
jgi:hypothetical protein